MRNSRIIFGAVLGVALVALNGCTKSPPPIVTVEGRVMLNGKPVPKAEVRFYPAIDYVDGAYIAIGETDDDGHFKLVCNGQDGACACENKVTVGEAPLPDNMRGMSAAAQQRASAYMSSLKNRPLPKNYSILAQSPLSVAVTADQKEYLLELTNR